ncbi:HAD-IB family hydrolase [uncultured Capnocytophaga sp.]|uniref:HAD family hydrolase n=1 Tax=uncultured Capnocytophaga sp. TaxID=159273 RepID=UPI0026151D41|nr:HAD-IB family hydrolase [uncultured Capnocytophaga sp.]
MKNKIALFDFCDTLVDFQTGDAFIDFIRENTDKRRAFIFEKFRSLLIKIKFFSILNRFLPNNNWHKRLKLFQLKGITKNEIEHLSLLYYTERIKPRLIKRIIQELQQYKKEGYSIYIVSGGFSDYIIHFCKEFEINQPIATNIKYKKGICLGIIDGIDCMHAAKIDKIKNVIELQNVDMEQSVAYSDSITDLPLLTLVKNGVVVSKKYPQYWVATNKLKEIII